MTVPKPKPKTKKKPAPQPHYNPDYLDGLKASGDLTAEEYDYILGFRKIYFLSFDWQSSTSMISCAKDKSNKLSEPNIIKNYYNKYYLPLIKWLFSNTKLKPDDYDIVTDLMSGAKSPVDFSSKTLRRAHRCFAAALVEFHKGRGKPKQTSNCNHVFKSLF